MALTIIIGKIIQRLSMVFGKGLGSTWPGHVALKIHPHLIERLIIKFPKGVLFVAGTNGKTTTTSLITFLLEQLDLKVVTNDSGANLLNGIASSLVAAANMRGEIKADIGVFEVDENTLPLLLTHFQPRQIILLNIFRDQLDRYGEIEIIRDRWASAIASLTNTLLILNAEDPAVAYIGKSVKPTPAYFGLGIKEKPAVNYSQIGDSNYCPSCNNRLIYDRRHFSHLGRWSCENCGLSSPDLDQEGKDLDFPLPGSYNKYNAAAAVLSVVNLGFEMKKVEKLLREFTPAFGRTEEFVWNDTSAQLFLAKNPTGCNEALRTAVDLQNSGDTLLLVLNDNVPDGRDVSWIWDVDFENFVGAWKGIITSGKRSADLALRIKYAKGNDRLVCEEDNLEKALYKATEETAKGKKLIILATYSAMLEVRKITLGRKLL